MINKKGVSIMIGYVLLVTTAIVLSVLVFAWLKSYVPQGDITCPDGVSIIINDAQCILGSCEDVAGPDCDKFLTEQECIDVGVGVCSWNDLSGDINLIVDVKNTGTFDLYGYYIKATVNANQEIAIESLSLRNLDGTRDVVVVPETLKAGKEKKMGFDLLNTYLGGTPTADATGIFSIDVIPARWGKINNVKQILQCGDAKVSYDIACPVRQCNDGLDNDGLADGIDFPEDPECVDALDDDEST